MPVIGISLLSSCHKTEDMYTDHQGTDDQCGPRSATCQCPSVPHQCHISVHTSFTSMPHISAHLSCLSMSPISVSQCHLSMPISATYQCHAHQCHLSVSISAAYQCPSLQPH
ncbi:unnamed protein product [Staurois parvus]|uniref:Uncharacterized protein n=1 Tax=Staurois parvus TaxID=386267 RepID=A0ABN9E7T9_9NEOB|nr:unnamed protein product [Staurois parvus]